MKNLQVFLVAISFCLVLTSCSNEEEGAITSTEKSTISFGSVLQDLELTRQASKQSLDDLPACSDDDPFYVRIILSRDGINVVGTEEAPFRIDLIPNQNFTEEVPELELEPGNYTLEYFAVYNEDGDLIWLAPNGGIFTDFFDNPMPMNIELNAGVKKYVEVSVVCFDNRFVNEYGYLFFDLVPTPAIEFCIFGNYCDETGRHYPAAFSVDVWSYSNGMAGAQLYSNVSNTVTLNDAGDYAGTPVCFALPDTEGLDEYYFEITLLNSDAYGVVTEEIIRSGVINDEDVRNLFDGPDATDYYHFREGDCNMDDSPNLFEEGGGNGECDPNDPNDDCDNDGVININDDCPDTEAGIEVDLRGCESVQVPGRDVVVFNDNNIFMNSLMDDPDNVRLVQNLVNFSTSGARNDGDVVWMDRGRGANCYNNGECNDTNWGTMRDVITDSGFTITNIFSTGGDLTDIPADVKVIFLIMPTVDYTMAEINELKEFASEGGRIIFVGEHDGFYFHIDVQNEFLANMGAVLFNTGGALDCGLNVLPSTSNRSHPIMEGIIDLTIACASVIEPGPNDFALFYDSTNSYVLAGVAKIDVTPITELRPITAVKRPKAPVENIPNTSSGTGY